MIDSIDLFISSPDLGKRSCSAHIHMCSSGSGCHSVRSAASLPMWPGWWVVTANNYMIDSLWLDLIFFGDLIWWFEKLILFGWVIWWIDWSIRSHPIDRCRAVLLWGCVATLNQCSDVGCWTQASSSRILNDRMIINKNLSNHRIIVVISLNVFF